MDRGTEDLALSPKKIEMNILVMQRTMIRPMNGVLEKVKADSDEFQIDNHAQLRNTDMKWYLAPKVLKKIVVCLIILLI